MRRPIRKIAATASTGLLVAAGLMLGGSPASAANITCNNVSDSKNHTYITHWCTGTGTLTYSRDCFIGKDAVATYKFTGPKEHVRLTLDCGWRKNGTNVTYTVS